MAAAPPVDIKKLIRDWEEKAKAARKAVDDLKRAGIEAPEQEKAVRDMEISLERMKAVYGS